MSNSAGQTPFRGVPIISAEKLVAPIMSETFLSNNYPVVGQGRKAKVTGIKMGFKVFVSMGNNKVDENIKGGPEEVLLADNGNVTSSTNMEARNMFADVSLHTRNIRLHPSSATLGGVVPMKAHDFRLAPHAHMDMEVCHVMSFYYNDEDNTPKTIMNLDFNASHEVAGGLMMDMGGGGMTDGAGAGSFVKKHTWRAAVPSAIDESGSEDENSDALDAKRCNLPVVDTVVKMEKNTAVKRTASSSVSVGEEDAEDAKNQEENVAHEPGSVVVATTTTGGDKEVVGEKKKAKKPKKDSNSSS